MTDAAVPEGHKGLHGFLYGEGGAEEHDSRQYSIRHVSAAVAAAECMWHEHMLSVHGSCRACYKRITRHSWRNDLRAYLSSITTPAGRHRRMCRADVCPSSCPFSGSRVTSAACSYLQGEDDGQSILPVAEYLTARDGEKPVGVYALYDVRRELQYVGFARNIVLAVKVRGAMDVSRARVPLHSYVQLCTYLMCHRERAPQP